MDRSKKAKSNQLLLTGIISNEAFRLRFRSEIENGQVISLELPALLCVGSRYNVAETIRLNYI